MNAKQKKALFILLGIIVVLVAALLLLRFHNKQTAAAAAASSAAAESQITAEGQDYTALAYSNGTATLSFSKDADGKWSWADEPDFPLNQSDMTILVNIISGLTPQQTITDGDTMAAYGLDNPTATLTATAADGTETVFKLGKTTADGAGNYYLQINGDESTVYVVTDDLYTQLSRGIYDMMELPTLPKLSENNLLSVTIQGAATSQLIPTKTGTGDSAKVSWNCNGTDVTGQADLATMVSELGDLSLKSCADYKPTKEAVSLCGFDAPAFTLTVSYTNDSGSAQTMTLTVGSQNSDQSGYYVRVNDDTTIYTIPVGDLSTLLTIAANGFAA